MSVPVQSAVVNLNTLPGSSGTRSGAHSAESPSESVVARSVSRPAQGSSTARFTVRSANSLSFSSLRMRSANLRRQCHVFEEEAGKAEAKQGKSVVEQARGVSVVLQPHTPRDSSVSMDVRERGRAPSRVKFTPDTKSTNDTGVGQIGTASDSKHRLGSHSDDQGKASGSGIGSPRGRTEWRKESMQSRSKSLDWRGGVESRGRAGIQDFPGAFSRRAESLERRGVKNSSLDRRALFKDCGEVGSLSSRIQAYCAASGSEKPTPLLGERITGTSSLRLNKVVRTLDRTGGERSLPVRLKPQDTLKSPVEGSNPWRQSSQDNSAFGGSSKPNEVTGNQTILDRIEKLYGMSGSDDSKIKRHSAPVGDWLDNLPSDINLTPGQRKLSSDIGCPSYTPHGSRSQMPHNLEKGGTFPRRFSQGDRKPLEDRTYFSQSISRKETSPTQTIPVTSLSLRYQERSVEKKALHHPEVGLYTKSLDRSRSRLSATAQLKHLRETETPSKESSTDTVSLHMKGAGVVKERSLKDKDSRIAMDKDSASRKTKQSVTANGGGESGCKFGKSDGQDKHSRAKDSERTLAMVSDVGKIPTKVYSSDKGFASSYSKTQTNPAKESRNGTEDEDVFDTHVNAMKGPSRKQESEKATCNNPSMDSVRNTIHKFEALAQQSQTTSQSLKSRRFFSIPEDPKDRGGLKKSESDHALGQKTQEERNKALIARSFSVDEVGLKQDNYDKSEVGLKSGTTKPFSKVTDLKSLVDPQNDLYKRRKDMDEPDSSTGTLAIKNTITIRGIAQSNSKPEHAVFPYHKNNHNNNSNGMATFVQDDSIRNISKVSDGSEEDADITPTNSPDRLPLLPGFNGQLPDASKPHVSSVNNIDHPSDDNSEPPTSTNSVHFTQGPLLNQNPKGFTDCPPLDRLSLLDKMRDSGSFSPSVARWSSDEEDDEDDDGTQKDENSDYDSDSGESSVTITSDMSRRSFAVRSVTRQNKTKNIMTCTLLLGVGKNRVLSVPMLLSILLIGPILYQFSIL